MDRWKDLLLKKLSCEKDLQTAYRLVLNFFNNQGFEYCAFSAYLGSPDKHTSKVNLNNYPYGWDRLYEQNGYASNDPLVAHCNQSTLPILWDENLFAQAPKLWRELNRQGLKYGWTQAVHDEQGAQSSLSALHEPIVPLISRSIMAISATPSSPVKSCMRLPAKNWRTPSLSNPNVTCHPERSKY
ncbi:autoinducer binding domain-containing protein [Pseudomonas sp. Z1-12]|uniref:autoinducer binding domain-containing protein n=1 Tax=Pseudomonas sp. Z1-12 TaxID=2817408 RepID=UPI003DA7B0DE